MENKLLNLQTWDWKSIRNSFLLIAGLAVVFYFLFWYSSSEYEKNLAELDGVVQGKILKIENIEYYSQSFEGNKKERAGYKITFHYKIENQVFQNIVKIKSTQKQARKVMSMHIRDGKKEVKVKYDTRNPEKSLIDFN